MLGIRIRNNGFTIVELTVVIAVIGILAAISVVGYGSWRTGVAKAEVQSDLKQVAAVMESARNFNNTYPLSIPTSFTSTPTVTVTYTSGDATSFCIDGVSIPVPTVAYFVSSSDKVPILGTCVGGPGALPSGGGGGGVAAITSMYDHTCAVSTTSLGYCWGSNDWGEIGNNQLSTNALTPQAVSTAGVLSGKTIKQLSAGASDTCAVASDNLAYCWGYNIARQLGNQPLGFYGYSAAPVSVTMAGGLSGKTIKQVTTGSGHSCAIASDNNAYCWGWTAYGQLGDGSALAGSPNSGDNAQSSQVVAVSASGVLSGKTIKQIVAGYNHTCAIASDNNAYCWGKNNSGQLGAGYTSSGSNVPVAVSTSGVLSGKTIKQIAANAFNTCAIASDDQAYCWGQGSLFQLGNNSSSDSNVPVAVSTSGVLSGKTIKQIAAGNTHTCVIASDDKAYCWGANGSGQLGSSGAGFSPVAVDTSGALSGRTLSSISTGDSFTCALDSTTSAYCWGSSSLGKIGDNQATSNPTVPVAVSSPF
ncbi:MAG: repeat-containing protein [Candidatus Saccharibacteria bacterium]|nr:repeat-containing protein [Candidatus Saccharibacteria bacterium]